MTGLILKGFLETVYMVSLSFFNGILIGVPLGITLFTSSREGLRSNKLVNYGLGFFINATRSIPYIILTVLMLPICKLLVGTTIGSNAAVIPLSLSAILLIAKIVEESLKSVPYELIESGIAMGATNRQIIWKIALPESKPQIISGVTLVLISLIGFSAMAGTIGGGGLGDLAIRYGYQRYNLEVMFIIIIILIIMIQSIQIIGNKLTQLCRK